MKTCEIRTGTRLGTLFSIFIHFVHLPLELYIGVRYKIGIVSWAFLIYQAFTSGIGYIEFEFYGNKIHIHYFIIITTRCQGNNCH